MWTSAVFMCVIAVLCGSGKCDECDESGHLVYEDLGCKPITKDGSKCPDEYDCGDLTRKVDSCNFKSRQYNLGEKIDDDLIYSSCNIDCSCGNDTAKASFTCAILDCPEWLGPTTEPGCYMKYELGKCCSVGSICPPFKDFTCKVDDEEHNVGTEFSPKNTCKTCVCKEGFKGEYTDEFCSKSVCAVQLRHADDLEANCAAGYFSKPACCPDTWICPDTSDKIKVINPNVDSASNLTCKYGENTLKLGEGVERTIEQWGAQRNMKCECKLPPFLSCFQV